MSTPQPPAGESPRPRGSHRADAPASTSLLLPILGVLGVLAALGLAGYMLLTSGDDDEPTVQPPPSSSPTTEPEPTESTEPSKEPTKEPTKQPSDEPTKQQTKNPDNDNGGGGNTNNTGNGGGGNTLGPVPAIDVYVFNQTTITGYAAQTAGALSAAGWNVAGYDNWRGVVPEDTVYYYPGDRAAAVRLSREFPFIGRVWPASSPMPGGAITVILADTDPK